MVLAKVLMSAVLPGVVGRPAPRTHGKHPKQPQRTPVCTSRVASQ
jgi:hypothetical protein